MASLSSSFSAAALPSTISFLSSSQASRGIGASSLLSGRFSTRRLQISCQVAKPETVEKVIEIVAKQLASDEGKVQPHSKFQDLGADSLDQVEIVMALEEKFGISVDESGAESIVTVQDAANLIEKARADTV